MHITNTIELHQQKLSRTTRRGVAGGKTSVDLALYLMDAGGWYQILKHPLVSELRIAALLDEPYHADRCCSHAALQLSKTQHAQGCALMNL
jgi:hypothetical protein